MLLLTATKDLERSDAAVLKGVLHGLESVPNDDAGRGDLIASSASLMDSRLPRPITGARARVRPLSRGLGHDKVLLPEPG
jgi:hypothetical protein